MSDAYERVEVESQAAWRAWLVAETVARAERGARANSGTRAHGLRSRSRPR